jgi:hypothetical protein
LLAVALSVMTSVTAAATNLLVGRLKALGVGVVATYGVRFWLTVAAAMGIGVQAAFAGLPATPSGWSGPVLFGLFGVAIPLFAVQVTIRRLGAWATSLLIALHPGCVLGIQVAREVVSPDWLDLLGLGLITTGVVVGLTAPRWTR